MKYVQIWRNKFLTMECTSIDGMINELDAAVTYLKAMRDDGVTLDPEGGTGDDYAFLVTEDEAVAEKHGLCEEEEYWGE